MHWNKYAGNPVINRLEQDQDVSVVKSNGTYYLYSEVNNSYLDLFTSGDGIHWALHPSSPIKTNAASPVVWVENGKWYMLYECMGNVPTYRINYATSSDGVHWTDYSGNPVIVESTHSVPDSVVKEGSTYHLYWHKRYQSSSAAWPAMHATSTDLIHWSNKTELSFNLSSPAVFRRSDGQVWIYAWNLLGDLNQYIRYGQDTSLNDNQLYWSLDESSGDTAYDSSGNSANATLLNGAFFTGAHSGNGVWLDGVDDSVDTHYNTQFPVWTVAAWVKGEATPGSGNANGPVHREANYVIGWDHPSANFRGAAAVEVKGKWYPASFGPLEGNTWYHLAATYDGETLKAYKNGALVTSNSAPSGCPDTELLTARFGRNAAYPNYFNGTIDEVHIYNRALSAQEISDLANSDPNPILPPTATPASDPTGVPSGNVLLNPSFEQDSNGDGVPDSWFKENPGAGDGRMSYSGADGSYVYKISPSASTSQYQSLAQNYTVTGNSGDVWEVRLWSKQDQAATTGSVRVRWKFINSSGAIVEEIGRKLVKTAAGNYQTVSVTTSQPYSRVKILVESSLTNSNCYFDNVTMQTK